MKRQKRQSNHRSYLALACLLWTALLLTVYALAAETAISNLNVPGVSASYDGTWSQKPIGQSSKITGKVKGNRGGTCLPEYSSNIGKLILKNGSEGKGTLEFKIEYDTGNVKIGDDVVNSGSTQSYPLDKGGSVTISFTSLGSSEDDYDTECTITVSNISFTPNSEIEVTFEPATNGTYTVKGADDSSAVAVSSAITRTQGSADTFLLTATAANNYKFFGWYDRTNDTYLSLDNPATIAISSNCTVSAVFTAKANAVFSVGGQPFVDLNDATAYADSSGASTIILISDGTLPAGSYTIKSGKTLLIPFDAANTVYTTAPEVVFGAKEAPSVFRTLTMAKNAKIIVAEGGALSVPSKLRASGTNGTSYNGCPTGKYGKIAMNAGSSITLESGAGLYCYGYISGSGAVTAASGSTVYECFQIRSWRGGSATSDMEGNDKKVFPINQYYVQNIEAPLILEGGATEKVYTAVNMSSKAFTASATFIGNNGMFIADPGSKITKRFDGAADRLIFDIEGNAKVSSMQLKIAGLPLIGTLDLNTADYVLPINSNITVNINSGTTTVNQDLAMLPGSQLSIAKDAALTISEGKNVYVYDKDQWGPYAAAGAQLVPVGYSTVNKTTAKRNDNSLVDATIDVNGTLTVAGALYTTSSGANITSSKKTGKVVLNAAAGTATKTQQATQSDTRIAYVDIPITAAQLKNGDGSYTATAGASANDEFSYCATCDMWKKKPHSHDSASYNVTISWPELKFTYTRSTSTTYTWDGEGKKYEAKTTDNSGSWSGPIDIGVCNKSSAGAVNAQFAFAQVGGNTWAAMQFSDNEGSSWNDGTSTLSLPKPDDPETGIKKTVTATLSGTPAAGFTEGQIGTITVTITAAQGG